MSHLLGMTFSYFYGCGIKKWNRNIQKVMELTQIRALFMTFADKVAPHSIKPFHHRNLKIREAQREQPDIDE